MLKKKCWKNLLSFFIRAALWAEELECFLEYCWSWKNTLGKHAVAINTGRHLIRVLNERSLVTLAIQVLCGWWFSNQFDIVSGTPHGCDTGILADVIVYIFAHLHTALLAEGNMLDINWLQEVKVLVKLNACWNIWLFVHKIQGEIVFQKLQNLWVAKVLLSSYILCKILSFKPVLRKKYSIHRAHIHWQS